MISGEQRDEVVVVVVVELDDDERRSVDDTGRLSGAGSIDDILKLM